MKVIGIIAEYNPFHKGHLYQISQCKKNKDDFVIAVMSGDFVQRGAAAIFNKYHRTEMALNAGIDLVIELPAIFATASASVFSEAGISILDQLGCVDEICFGCETSDFNKLNKLATFLAFPPEKYHELINQETAKGNSYPKARECAVSYCLSSDYIPLLQTANNILALEYLISLKKRNSQIKANPLTRTGADYHDIDCLDAKYPSATSLRNHIVKYIENLSTENFDRAFQHMEQIEKGIPLNSCLPMFHNHFIKDFLERDDFSYALHYKLLSEEKNGFEAYYDITADLSSKIIKNIRNYRSFTQFCDALKSKNLTYNRISRCLLHILLNIKQEDIITTDHSRINVPYARILGFQRESQELLSKIKKNSSIPLISKLADANELLDNYGQIVLSKDIFCSHLYASTLANKKGVPFKSEFEQQIIII